jgi:hypothetical protein
MRRQPQSWSLLKIAKLAGVSQKVAYEARDRSLLVPQVLGPSDVLPLRTFDALRRVSWPRQNYARNVPNRLRLWEVLAIERSRIQLDDIPATAGMYVHLAGAQVVVSASQHVIAVLRLVEASSPNLYLPLGAWAQQAREELAHECQDELSPYPPPPGGRHSARRQGCGDHAAAGKEVGAAAAPAQQCTSEGK